MNRLCRFFPIFTIVSLFAAHGYATTLPPFSATISSIPAQVQKQMRLYTWRPGCPVPLSSLSYIKMTYYGFDHRAHQGILIVNRALAPQVVSIFKTLYQHHFEIDKMIPMYKFHGDDELAMEHDNSSSFNCRAITGHPGIYSQHSYGRAIDINTEINPYVKGNLVLPPSGRKYLNRCQNYPGIIQKDKIVYNTFIADHWVWGGSWYDVHDYQHFEKRANGQLRNPFGYGSSN